LGGHPCERDPDRPSKKGEVVITAEPRSETPQIAVTRPPHIHQRNPLAARFALKLTRPGHADILALMLWSVTTIGDLPDEHDHRDHDTSAAA
jgi:hypothetical protein